MLKKRGIKPCINFVLKANLFNAKRILVIDFLEYVDAMQVVSCTNILFNYSFSSHINFGNNLFFKLIPKQLVICYVFYTKKAYFMLVCKVLLVANVFKVNQFT